MSTADRRRMTSDVLHQYLYRCQCDLVDFVISLEKEASDKNVSISDLGLTAQSFGQDIFDLIEDEVGPFIARAIASIVEYEMRKRELHKKLEPPK